MDYPAKNTDNPNIMHSFGKNRTGMEGMFAMDVCSQTLRNKLLGKRVAVGNWMFECYSDFAGDISFLTPGAGKKGKREKTSVHLYAPGCVFREDTRNADIPLRESFMHFTGGAIGGLDKIVDGKSKFCRFLDPEQKVISLMLDAAGLCALKGDKAFWQVQAILMRCLDYFLNHSVKISGDTYEIREESVSSQEKFVMEAEEFMRRNISRKIKNSDIAEFMNMGESSFSHKFSEASGMPPNARLLEMRMDAAKGLLLKGARMKNIAEAIGFMDEFYLSRVFKKITGVSPRDFRAGRG